MVGATVQFAEKHRIGKGFGEALVIDHRAKDSEGGSSLVLIVEMASGKSRLNRMMSVWVMWFRREVW